jgi:actin-related protein
MFETFSVPAFFIGNKDYLSMYASRRTSGSLLNCGDGVTTAASYCEGFDLFNTKKRIDLGGRDVVGYLTKLLNERDLLLKNNYDEETVFKIKEDLCYIGENGCVKLNDKKSDFEEMKFNFDEKNFKIEEKKFELSDGNKINIQKERILAPEILFNPSIIGLEVDISKLILNSIKKSHISIRKTLFENIIICGGTSLFNGLKKEF